MHYHVCSYLIPLSITTSGEYGECGKPSCQEGLRQPSPCATWHCRKERRLCFLSDLLSWCNWALWKFLFLWYHICGCPGSSLNIDIRFRASPPSEAIPNFPSIERRARIRLEPCSSQALLPSSAKHRLLKTETTLNLRTFPRVTCSSPYLISSPVIILRRNLSLCPCVS